MAGEDLVICRKCGGIMLMDGMAKVRADIADAMGLEVVSPVCMYSCESCGVSFTEHERTPVIVSKLDDDGPEYGSNLWELNFDK